MKKKNKFILGALAFILIPLILWLANGFLGNPISKSLANRSAEKYIEKTYPNMTLELDGAVYDFYDGKYNVLVTSPDFDDVRFSIDISQIGKIVMDSYGEYVGSGFNTWERINIEYRNMVDEIIESKDFNYNLSNFYGEIKIREDEFEDLFGKSYGLKIKELELDEVYDIKKLGRESGHLVLNIEDEKQDAERASEILVDIKNIFDSKDIPFYAIDLSLAESKSEVDSENRKAFEIREFRYSEINEEGLNKGVEEAAEDLKEYYKQQKIKRQSEEMED